MYALEILLVVVGASSRSSGRSSRRRSAGSRCSALLVALLALHAVLGVLPARSSSVVLLVVARVARARTATRRGGCSSRWRSAGSRSSRGCRRSSTSARTPARRGARRVLPGHPARLHAARLRAAATTQEGWLLPRPAARMLLLGLFGRATDERRIEIDLHTQPGARWEAIVGGATLVVALDAQLPRGRRVPVAVQRGRVPVLRPARRARASRRSRDPRVRAGVLAVVVGLGFVGGGAQRRSPPHAGRRRSRRCCAPTPKPGDLVVYCPDQLGPAVHRLVPPGLDEVDVPERSASRRSSTGSTTRRGSAAADPAAFARAGARAAPARTRSGSSTSPGYITHPVVCETLSDAVRGRAPAPASASLPDERIFEHPGLQEFPARTPASG